MKISIAQRIKRAMLGLTIGLCLVFTLLSLLLMYVVEDQVFINLLRTEQIEFESIREDQIGSWQPANRSMEIVYSLEELPKKLQSAVFDEANQKFGIYEYFNQGDAYFILFAVKKTKAKNLSYYITFNVSHLLAVRSGRVSLYMTIALVSLLVLIMAIFVTVRLSHQILEPLKKLTDKLQNDNFDDLPKGFAKDFTGDEIGILATQLEVAINQTKVLARHEFEFNRGVSHELRTPIQVALNAVELLEINLLNKPSIGKKSLSYLQPILRLKRSIVQMEQISEAFLWFASDRSQLQSNTDGNHVVEVLTDKYLKNYPTKPIRLVVNPDKAPQYPVPESVFTVILDNLLRNALQHGSEGEVCCTLNLDFIQITNNYVPDEFSKSNNDVENYGVGLSIVKRICQHLNWQLELTIKNERMHTNIAMNTTNL